MKQPKGQRKVVYHFVGAALILGAVGLLIQANFVSYDKEGVPQEVQSVFESEFKRTRFDNYSISLRKCSPKRSTSQGREYFEVYLIDNSIENDTNSATTWLFSTDGELIGKYYPYGPLLLAYRDYNCVLIAKKE